MCDSFISPQTKLNSKPCPKSTFFLLGNNVTVWGTEGDGKWRRKRAMKPCFNWIPQHSSWNSSGLLYLFFSGFSLNWKKAYLFMHIFTGNMGWKNCRCWIKQQPHLLKKSAGMRLFKWVNSFPNKPLWVSFCCLIFHPSFFLAAIESSNFYLNGFMHKTQKWMEICCFEFWELGVNEWIFFLLMNKWQKCNIKGCSLQLFGTRIVPT